MSQGSHDNKGNSGNDNQSSQPNGGNGYDREHLYEPIDWMTFSHETLYNMVHTGVNLDGAQAAATNWQKIGEDIAGVRTSLLKAVEDSTVGWDSESARLARDGLTEVTNWVDDTSTYAHKVAAAITTETNNVEAARAAMPPPPKAPEPPVPVEPQVSQSILRADRFSIAEGVDSFSSAERLRRDSQLVEALQGGEFRGFEAVGTSPVDTLAANDASHRLAADVMAAFQRNSAAVDQTVPSQFTPPVNPVNPNPPTLGGPDTGGRTPVPDGGAGGGTGAPVATTPGATNRGTTNTSSRGYGGGAGARGGGGGFTGGMMPGRIGSNSNQGAAGGGGAGGSGGAGLSAGVNERAGAGGAAAAASSATGGQTRAFQNPLAMGGAPMAGAPAAAQGRDDEREHKSASYLEEDDNVFGLDRKAAPPVIGQ